jgi:drug/metabolite transporter (DMT)-like permease
VVAGVIGYAGYTVLLRALGGRPADGIPTKVPDPVVLAAGTAVWGLVFLAPWQVWEIAAGRATLPADVSAGAAVLYLGVVASGGTLLLWTYGASRVPASIAGVLTGAIPALGYVFAVLSGEPATWAKTAGGALAVAGVLVATRAATRPAASQQRT